MADKDRKADAAKRRAEEDEEDEALAGKRSKADARDEAEAESESEPEDGGTDDEAEGDDDEHGPAVKSGAVKEVDDAKTAARVEKRAAAKKRPSRLAQRRQPPKGSLAKSLMLFVIIVGGLIVAFALIGKEDPGATGPVPAPKWAVGQTVDLEVTVVPSDAKDLACSSPEEMGGKKCQFEAPGKAYAPAQTDDKKVFKPYTTTDRIQFIGAGLWGEPALAPGKLPQTRFSVKCKFAVEGKLKSPGVRWNSDGPWFPQTTDWYAGSLTGCVIAPP